MSQIIVPVSLQLLIIAISLFMISKTSAFSMKMIPIESPHLQILPNHFTIDELYQFLANISMSRVQNLRNYMALDSPKLKVYTMSSRFVTQIGLGEGPGVNLPYLALDTASDLIWMQCAGCDPCFDLSQGKSFRYRQSPSFHRLSVDDHMCLPSPIPNYDGSCGFQIQYDISEPHPTITGLVGRENFRIVDRNTGKIDVYPNVVFGCALKIEEFSFGNRNSIAGIFGMSAGPRSFITQLDAHTKGRFSYCLAPFNSRTLAQSTFYFGDDAQIGGDDTRQVQTISMRVIDAFHLYMNGISVDGNRLIIDRSVFELDEHGRSTGFFIDSGAPITVLAKAAYDPLKNAVVDYFRRHYGLEPGQPGSGMDLCYQTTNPNYRSLVAPSVIFHFWNNNVYGEIDMVLNKNNMFQQVSDNGFCMAVNPVPNPGPCLFGAHQQVNFNILFDTRNSLLAFVPQYCREN